MKEAKKLVPVSITILLLALSLFILKDILVALISAYVLAFLMYPLYKRLSKNLPNAVASTISVIVAILIVILPIGLVIGTSINQLSSTIDSGIISQFLEKVEDLPLLNNLQLNNLTERFITLLVEFLRNTLSYIPLIAVYLFILIFGTYYFLVDWEKLSKKIKDYFPFKNKETFFKDISNSTKNIVYGTFLIALIELIFAALAFWILGIPSALVLATLIAIFAFIPGLGPLIVWIPLAIYLLLQQSYFQMIGVIIAGIILSAYIDGILRAQVSGKKANIHPFIMLIGIIGGISVFGVFGFIIGPIVLVSTLKLIDEIFYNK